MHYNVRHKDKTIDSQTRFTKW